MEELETVRARIRNKKNGYEKKEVGALRDKYLNGLISRILISVIVFLGVMIINNVSRSAADFIKADVLKDNMSFSKVTNLYNKYFGKVIPIKEVGKDTTAVFNEKITYSELKDYKDGYNLTVSDNYLIPVIASGIVVFVGEKEEYGNTIIVQGIDEVDYWYGNVENSNVSLYDYVSKGNMLGNTLGTNLYLVFQKNGEYLGIDEIIG